MLDDLINPYHAGRPVESPEMLFGRDDVLLWIEQQLNVSRRLLIVYGSDLIGKTSLVRCLPQLLPGHVSFLSFEFKACQGEALHQALVALVDEIARQAMAQDLGLSAPLDAAVDPAAALTSLLQQIAASLDSEQLLLLLDDAHLVERSEDDEGPTSLFDVLTALLASVPSLRLLLTMSGTAYTQLSHPLAAGAEAFRMGPLRGDEALQLITRPCQGALRCDAGAVKRIADITSNHPYYLHLFCQALFSRCAREGYLNQGDVDVVLEELLSLPNERFQAIWDQSDWAERAALVAMSALKGTHGLITKQEVVHNLQRSNEEVVPGIVVDALESLADRGALERMGASSYRFVVALFRHWLEHHFDPTTVLAQINWNRLSAQSDALQVERGTGDARRGWNVGNWAIVGLALTALCGAGLWVLLLTGTLPLGLFSPTPTPVPTDQPVTFISPVTSPTPTPVPLTPTPTNPVVVARTMPSIAFRARNVGSTADLPTWQILVMDADGTNRQRITQSDGEDITPTWSPEGQRIAYVSMQGDNRDIVVMPAPGASWPADQDWPFRVTQHPASDWTAAWSPDGQQITFSSNRTGYWEIFIVNADGTGLSQVTNDGAGALSPVWSPDGRTMAYSGKRDDNWDIYTMPAPLPGQEEDFQPEPRRLVLAEGNDLSPIYSPTGDRIVFESNRDGNAEIYVMNADGSNQGNVSNSPSVDDHGPVWSPDGKHILFYSSREGNWDLFLMTDDGRNVINLTGTPDVDEQEPAWRP